MRSFVITRLATTVLLLGATLLAGCDGGTGTATGFNPFGTDPSGATSEPTGSTSEMPTPGGQGSSIAQLCASVCGKVAAACPTSASPTCAASCSQSPTQFPNCVTELQAFLSCVSAAQITCASNGVEIPTCNNQTLALADCEGYGTAGTTQGGTAP